MSLITLGRERGFTMTELMVTCIILGIMVTIAAIAYASGTRKTEVVAATEQVKQALRYVYSLADSGALATTADPNTPKRRCRCIGEVPISMWLFPRYNQRFPTTGSSEVIGSSTGVCTNRVCEPTANAEILSGRASGFPLQGTLRGVAAQARQNPAG